ncbi:type I polyketide synthase [Streptomyces sp. NPDC050528]|uniref:type I polyketide synthase n=1 Tax=Streptomyces sp. NPDC050528 TaxID=3365623 RepID=UPI0037A8D0E2
MSGVVDSSRVHVPHSPIAVIGIACRLPGASGPREFWRALADGTDAVTPVPPDRWTRPSGIEPDPTLDRGAFLDRPDLFDAGFFGISPREAAAMDPQQRLMLELGWEALEDAGLPPSRISGQRTGVFVGAISDDYATLVRRHGGQAVTHHTLTGLNRGMIANRLSYLLGADGPSLVIDSGQSSSLVAVHTACQSLRAGECETAVAGGVHLNLAFDGTLSAARFGGLSPDGRCFTFDSRANGFVRGEGGGLVLLKPLDRALADGDRVHGVLRGSAVNNDGGGDTLTTPNRAAQTDVVRRARAAAGIGPTDVQYVELHGTGTPVGDPVEAAALAEAAGSAPPGHPPLRVGSAKTNVGHLEGAAGITGLIKVLLSLKARRLPPSLNFRTANPAIPLDTWNLRVQTELSDWPRPDAPLVAGVSAFGVGGTNAHVIVAEPPTREDTPATTAPTPGVLPWVVSGRSPEGLRAQAARLRDFVTTGDASHTDIGWSLARHRAALEHRAVVVAGDRDGFLAGLDAIAVGEPAAHVVSGTAGSDSGVVFVFPGQGSQWVGMAAELLDSSPVFAESVGKCARALAPYIDWDLIDVLRGGALDRVDVVQPALWAVMVSLAEVWRSSGVEPAAVVGHSQGEIAAACVAGVLSLDDGARLVALRSQVIARELAGQGGMLSVAASAGRLAELLVGRDELWVATVNGPESTVVAGAQAALAQLAADAEAVGIRTRMIAVDYASHTPHVEQIRERLLEAAAPIVPRPSDIPMYSTVTAGLIEGEALDAEYWYRNLREQVRFHDTVRTLIAEGNSLFLEVSAHPVLTTAIEETGDEVTATGTLRRDHGGSRQLQLALAQLWAHGADIDWSRAFDGTGARRTDLPTYAFQRRPHWFDTNAVTEDSAEVLTDVLPAPVRPTTAAPGPVADVARRVRAQAAAVLGHEAADDIDPRRTFKDLGFDSIMLGDLRNRINTELGTRLTTATLFDHPTPAGLAEHLIAETAPAEPAARTGPGPDDEPIAVVAMSCRLPGGVHSPEDLWRLLVAGEDAITAFPEDRGWDLERLRATDAPGASVARGGGFLDQVAEFDARFFGLSPREVLAMDPQQRLLLEISWELLERAGIPPVSLRDSPTGVFVGTMDQEYGPRLHEAPEMLDGYLLTGKTTSVASGRIAYLLGLTGPAITLDTACSSSLVALHLAVQSLRRGESSLALAGGVTVLNTPGIFTEFSRQGGLSRDGRCKAFAAAADGTGMAEGAGLLLLERLSDARRNGHQVLAVIRGSAVNQDGASNGLTAPSGISQQRLIRQALAGAGIAADEVDVVEAHGTGTSLGDPIEAQALLATYGQGRPAERPLLLGSLKSNIGHTQAAAGVAGVIKMVMAMRHGVVPATLHVDEPSPQVDWSAGAAELVTERTAWPETDRVRRAAVSSFGISGTNAHVIVEAVSPASSDDASVDEAVPAGGVVPWVVSGRSAAGLRAQAARLREFAAARDDDSAAVAWSLATRRDALEHRAVVVAGDREGFLAGLDAIAVGEPAAHVVGGAAGSDSGVVFVFPGQGSQWVGMAAELLDSSPVFAESVGRCADALAPHTDWDLLDVLRGGALDRVDVVQPALWAVMVSLAEVWRSSGVEPTAVIGHSQGEIAAACVAGALTLEDGARLVALRSRVIARELAGQGGMLSVAASAGRVAELLVDRGELWIATVNGPESTVVAGAEAALAQLATDAEAEGIRTRMIAVDYASHTPHVEQIRTQLMEAAGPITPRPTEIPMYSTVTAGPIEGESMNAEYWYRNLREQVRFHDTVRTLIAEGNSLFLEVSAHPVLTTAIEETGDAVTATGTLRRDEGGRQRFLTALAQLWVHGVTPDWSSLLPATTPVDLPTYAFQRDRYWLAPSTSSASSTPSGSSTEVRVELPSAPVAEVPEGFPRRVAEATSEARRKSVVLDEVCRHAAAVLGWSSAREVDVRRAFRELGFDSLTGVELRNRLVAATGLTLAPAVVFDHPTPLALAEYLLDRTLGRGHAAEPVSAESVSAQEPIAIVAVGCRFPGGVRSPEDLWDLLLSDGEGAAVNSGFPVDRGWDLDALHHPDTTRPGSCYVHQGGFLHDAGEFDAGFFGLSPREALAMDPQQRLLMETSWETLERAGIDPFSLRGSRTGVFVGFVPQAYGSGVTDTQGTEGYLFTGAAGSVASGRIAYTLGLTGPAVTVDTACSSSLVALHLAVQSLRGGECGMALVGGVSVMTTPGIFTEFSHQRGLSPDGLCKPFAAAADGTAWAEGVGVLLVERLSDARRNGHQVLAVVRGSALNQDGASNGLTAPNGPSQENVIRQALANAGVAASEVDVVEAHGTGTSLGDPIEAGALLATYGQGRPAERPLLLGSLKSNIGHTQAVSGIAGVIKTVMALRHGVVPATLHVDEPSPKVDWSAGAVELVTEQTPWPVTDRVRRAAVSSFGVSGTNAHVIVEAAASASSAASVEGSSGDAVSGVVPWVVSGRSVAGLRAQAVRLREFAATRESNSAAVAWSLASRRAALEHRAVVVAEGREEFLAGLEAIAVGEPAAHVVSGTAGRDSGVVFVFPGQGSQWVGMAAELLDSSRVFAESVGKCARALASYIDWDLIDVLRGGALDRVDVVQPALWAVMVSLAEVWRSSGVEPAAVVGHSQGEIAAACVAGALSLDDGARLVALRSQVIACELAGQGGMLSVAASAGRVAELLVDRGELWVATVNGPDSTVVAGGQAALAQLAADAEAVGIRTRMIAVDYASHTPHVEQIRTQLMEAAGPITPRPTEIPMYSTVTAGPIEGESMNAEYWYRNLREQVRFHDTVRTLIDEGNSLFLEVSAHPVLTTAIEETGDAVTAIGTLRRDQGGSRQFLTALAQLWTHGVTPDWSSLLPATTPVDLPTYAFQHEHYWLTQGRGTTTSDPHADFWAVVERQDPKELARILGLPDTQGELARVLPALSAWHRRRNTGATPGSRRYGESWVPLADDSTSTALSGTWIVAVASAQVDGETHRAMVEALRGRGAVAETVVAPDEPGCWGDLLGAYPAVAGVVSLLAADDSGGVGRTLPLIQAMAKSDAPLWCVTQGAVSVGAHDPLRRPEQAQVWGLGRVAAQELPAQWGGLIDLPETPDRRSMDRLCAVLAADDHEDQVAVRGTGTFGRRLVRARPSDLPETDGWRPGAGTALITGGTGALGGHVARRLAERGAEHLLLVSRRGDTAPGTADLVAELVRTGTRVTVAACDVADGDALRELLASIPDEYPLTSVFHTAAVLDDAAVEALTPERMDAVLRVKAGAAWHLHELTLGRELSAFVLFSSVAGSVGMAGQGNYAPANAYLDALARHRHARGLPATSVAWGPWARGGMADDDAVAELRERHGLPLLEPESAVLALEAELAHGEATAVVADIDWERFAHACTAVRPSRLLDGIPEARRALAKDAAPERKVADRRALLDAVRHQVAAVLGHGSAGAVSTRRPLKELGLDSVTAVELRNRLTGVTGIRLPVTVIFDHPSVTELVDHLAARLFEEEPSEEELFEEEPLAAEPEPGAERLEAATDDELFAFIEKEFGIS